MFGTCTILKFVLTASNSLIKKPFAKQVKLTSVRKFSVRELTLEKKEIASGGSP